MFIRILHLVSVCAALTHSFQLNKPLSRALHTSSGNRVLFPVQTLSGIRSSHALKAVTIADCDLQSTEEIRRAIDNSDEDYFEHLNKDIELLTSILGEVIKRENPQVHEVNMQPVRMCYQVECIIPVVEVTVATHTRVLTASAGALYCMRRALVPISFSPSLSQIDIHTTSHTHNYALMISNTQTHSNTAVSKVLRSCTGEIQSRR
jgi:hypothetical protein